MTTATDPLHALKLVELALTDIAPHPDNPRRIDDDHPSLDGLAQSIAATGLINPITVRENPLAEGDDARFQILAGERRWRAARKAHLTKVACRVVDVTDEQAFHILTVENLQREGLHWTEEARGVEAMLAKGWSAESIAAAVGRTVQWVVMREALIDLSPAWKAALADPRGDWHELPLNKLELIARFPHETQDHIRDRAYGIASWSVKDFADWLAQNYLRRLAKAPWKADDAELLPAAGACSACPKRSSCQQQLFAEAKDDSCLDDTCWKAKQNAHVSRLISKATLKTPDAILVRDGWVGEDAPEYAKKAAPIHQFKVVKKDDRGAKPAIVVAGDKVGQTIYVRPDPTYGPTKTTTAAGATAVKPKGKTIAERVEALEKRRANVVVLAFTEWFETQVEKMSPASLDAVKLTTLCFAFGVSEDAPSWEYEVDSKLARADVLMTRSGQAFRDELWQAVAPVILEAVSQEYRGGRPPIGAVEVLCERFGWSDLFVKWTAKAADEIAMPKALAADIALRDAKKPKASPQPPAKATATTQSKTKRAAAKA